MWLLRGQESPSTEQNDGGRLTADGQSIIELKEQFEQQQQLIQQLKELLRENEQQVKKKEHELEESASKLSKLRLQHKAKVADLTNQLKECKLNETSTDQQQLVTDTTTAGQNRGKIILLKKQLDENRAMFERREKEMSENKQSIEQLVEHLQNQLDERDRLISDLKNNQTEVSNGKNHHSTDISASDDSQAKKNDEIGFKELYAQIVYKDAKILELDSRILELERNIMDLQENLKEKDEILSARNQAIQLMTADLSRRGKVVVDQLDDTRDQMKLMQQNFASIEVEWKKEKMQLSDELEKLKEQHQNSVKDSDNKVQQMEKALATLETTRFELSSRNAQLQEKVVRLQEKLENSVSSLNSENEVKCRALQEEVNRLSEDLAKKAAAATEQSNSKSKGSDQMWLKLKAQLTRQIKDLEAQVAELQIHKEASEKVTALQQQVSLLEVEKKELNLRLIDYEETLIVQDRLKQQIDDLNVKIRQQNDDLDLHVKMVSTLETTKLDLVDQLFKQRTTLEDAEQQNEALTRQLEILKGEQEDFERKILQLEEQRTNLDVCLKKALDTTYDLQMNFETEKAQEGSAWEAKASVWHQTEAAMNEQIVELQSELQHDKEAKEELNKVIVEKDEDLKRLNDELCELRLFVEQKNKDWKSEKDQLNSLIQHLENSRDRYEDTLQNDSKRLQHLQVDANEKLDEICELKRQLAAADSEIERLRDSAALCSNQLASVQRRLELSEAEVEHLKKVAVETEEDFERILTERDQMLEDLKSDLRRINEESQTNEEFYQNQIDTLNRELNLAKSELNSSQDILTEKDNRLQEIINKISSLEINTSQQADDLQLSQDNIDRLHESIQTLKLQLESKSEELGNEKAEKAKLLNRIKELNEKTEMQKEELNLLQENLRETLKRVDSSSEMKIELESDIEQLKRCHIEQVKSLEIQINELTLKCDVLTEREKTMTDELHHLEAEVQTLTSCKQNLVEANLELEASHQVKLQQLQKANEITKESLVNELNSSVIVIESLRGELNNYASVSDVLCETQKQLEATLNEKQELMNDNLKLTDELKKFADELQKSNLFVEQLQGELKSNLELQDLLSTTQSQLETTLKETQELEKLNCTLKDQLNDSLTVAEQLMASNATTERLQKELENHVEVADLLCQAQQQLEEKANEMQNLLNQNCNLTEDLNSAKFEAGELRNSLQLEIGNTAQVQNVLLETQERLKSNLSEKQDLSTLNVNLTEELNSAREEIDELKRLKSSLEVSNLSSSLAQEQLVTVLNEKQELANLNLILKEQLNNSSMAAEQLTESRFEVERLQEELEKCARVSDLLRETQSQLDVISNEKQTLLAINFELKTQLSDALVKTEELTKLNSEIERLKEELEKSFGVSDLLRETQKQIETISNEKEELLKMNCELNYKLQSASDELNETKIIGERLQNELQTHLEASDVLTSTQKKLEAALNEKQDLLALNSELNDKLNVAEEEVEALRSSSLIMEQKQEELNATVSHEKSDLLTLNSGLKEELDDAREMVERLNSDAEIATEKYSELLKSVDEYVNEIDRLELEIQHQQNLISTQGIEVFELNCKISQLETAGSSALQAKQAAEVEIENLKKLVERLQLFEVEFQRCSETVGALELEMKQLRFDEEKLKEQNSRLMDYTQQLESDLTNISESSRVVEEQKEDFAKQIQQFLKDKDDAQSNFLESYHTIKKQLEENAREYEENTNRLKLELSDSVKSCENAIKNEQILMVTCTTVEEECKKLQLQLEQLIDEKKLLEKSTANLSEDFNANISELRNEINELENVKVALEKRVSEMEIQLSSDREMFEFQSRQLNAEIEILKSNSSDEVRNVTEKLSSAMKDEESQRMALNEELKLKDAQLEMQETIVLQLNERISVSNSCLNILRTFVKEVGSDLKEDTYNDADDDVVKYAIFIITKMMSKCNELTSVTEEQRRNIEIEVEQNRFLQEDLISWKSKLIESDNHNELLNEEVAVLRTKISELTGEIEKSNELLQSAERDILTHKSTIEQLNLRLEEKEIIVKELEKRAEEVEEIRMKLKTFIADYDLMNNSPVDILSKYMETSQSQAEMQRKEIDNMQKILEDCEVQWSSKLISFEDDKNRAIAELETVKRHLDEEHKNFISQLDSEKRVEIDHQTKVEQLEMQISSITQQVNLLSTELSNKQKENVALSDQYNEIEVKFKRSQDEFEKFSSILLSVNNDGDHFAFHDEQLTNNLAFCNLLKLIEKVRALEVTLSERNELLENYKFQLTKCKETSSSFEKQVQIAEKERSSSQEDLKNSKHFQESEQKTLTMHNDELELTIVEYQQQINDYRSKIAQCQQEKEQVCDELEQRLQQLQKLESNYNELLNQFNGSKQELLQLKEENSRFQQDLVSVSSTKPVLNVVEDHFVKSEADNNQEANITDRADSPQEMKKAMAVLKIKNEKMMTKLKMFKDKNDRLQIQINDLVTERNAVEDQNMRLSDHQQRAKDEIHRLSIELRNMDRLWKNESQQLHDRLQTLEMANDKLVDIKEDLENRLSLEMKLRKDLSQEKNDLEKLKSNLSTENMDAVKKLQEEFESRCQQLERNLNSEHDHNKYLESDILHYQDLSETLKKEKAKLEMEIKTQTELYQSMVSECSLLKDELEKMKAEHEEALIKLSSEFELQQKNEDIQLEDIQRRLIAEKEAKMIVERRVSGFQEMLSAIVEVLPDLNVRKEGEEFADVSVALKSFVDRANSVSVENEKLRSEVESLYAKSADAEFLIGRLSQLEEEILVLETENANLKEEIAKHSEELKQFMQQNQQLMDNLRYLESTLLDVTNQKENLESVIQQQSESILDLQNQSSGNILRETSHSQLQSAMEECDKVRLSRDNTVRELELLQRENNLLKDEVSKCKSVNSNQQDFVDRAFVVSESLKQSHDDERISQLEAELRQAVSSLHAKDLRCVELTDEISEFIEERDSLQIRLSSLLRADQAKELRMQMLEHELDSKHLNSTHSTFTNEESFTSTNSTNLDSLQIRLSECEKQRKGLLQMNAVLNDALTGERESRIRLEADLKFVEAELESRWKYKPKLKKETKLEIGEMETPLLAESPQIVERTYTGATWRIINWFQGRRRYFRRTIRTKHPLQLFWYFYVFVLHVAFLLIAF